MIIAEEWSRFTFRELINKRFLQIGDGYRAKNEELAGDGLIFLRAGHVTNTHIDFSGVDRFKPSLTNKVASKVAQVRDVIITTKGNSTGRVSFVLPDHPPFVYSPHLSFWRSLNEEKINQGFLRHWSRSKEFQEQLNALKACTDMAPYLSLIDQQRLRITLPPINEQRVIASVLDSLDSKIELNRNMNRTLEAMAQALFKAWFVDFEPVKAKAAGRTPESCDAETAALFPDEFVDSELGAIPKGWRVGNVYEIANVVYGAPFASKFFNECKRGTPLIRIRDLTSNEPQIYTEEKLPKGNLVHAGDVVVGMDGEFRAYWWRGSDAWLNQRVCAFYPIEPCNEVFVRFSLQDSLAFFERAKVGTTVIHLGKSDIDRMKFVVASEELLRRFTLITNLFLRKMIEVSKESRVLAALRDSLLPKLISGQLRIPDAEALAESV